MDEEYVLETLTKNQISEFLESVQIFMDPSKIEEMDSVTAREFYEKVLLHLAGITIQELEGMNQMGKSAIPFKDLHEDSIPLINLYTLL